MCSRKSLSRVILAVAPVAFILAMAAAFCCPPAAVAADWPTWRCDPNRSAFTSEQLPGELQRQWTIHNYVLEPAWPDEPRMDFDAAYQPIVMGGTLFVGSSRTNCVMAFDVATAAEKWRFRTDGPIRLAPAGWKDAVYVVSDDGLLYCLDAATGKCRWKHRGGPSERLVLGNERLISMWPARGGPVVYDGKVYFAAGIWPVMGAFIYALDAATGEVVWCNDGSGMIFLKQPHDDPGFGGLAPQGYMVATADKLLVSNGRAAAAALDRRTGQLLYFHHAKNKRDGHSAVAAWDDCFVNGGSVYELPTGKEIRTIKPGGGDVTRRHVQNTRQLYSRKLQRLVGPTGQIGVLAEGLLYQSSGSQVVAGLLSPPVETTVDDRSNRQFRRLPSEKWKLATTAWPMLRAGDRLYGADANQVVAIDLPRPGPLSDAPEAAGAGGAKGPKEAKVAWQQPVDGTVASMIAAAGRLFVVTYEGDIHCLAAGRPEGGAKIVDLTGAGEVQTAAKAAERGASPAAKRAETSDIGPASGPATASAPAAPGTPDGLAEQMTREIFEATGVTEGYCLVLGLADGRLAEGLTRLSKLRVIALEGDADKVAAFRRRQEAAGTDGARLSVIEADPAAMIAAGALPQYLASLIVSERGEALVKAPLSKLAESLRPYGGTLCLDAAAAGGLTPPAGSGAMAGYEVRAAGPLTLLVRSGPLAGAGTWTHEYGDSANTGVSADSLVRAPLGILWFGGLSNEKTLPRHSHGPSEEVIGGRVFMEGPDMMRALDVYTGRLLWQTDLLGVGRYYDHTLHAPGANALGTNFVATADSLYVVHNGRCVQLDTATGRQVRQFTSTAPAPAPISPRVNTRRAPASDATTGPDSAVATAPEWSYIAVWEDLLIGGASPVEFSTADFTAGDRLFRIRDDKGKLHDPKEVKKVTDLIEEIKQWRDFQFQEPPATVFTSSSASDPTKPPKTRATDEGDWAVVNLNHMLRQRDVLGKLPVRIVQAARQSYGDRIKKWEDEADKAAEKGDSYETPEPADIEEVQAGVMAHLADTHDPARGGPADQDLQWLNRKLLEVCYSTLPKAERMRIGQYSLDHTASRMIVVRDRRTGVALWSRQAAWSFIHNAIAVGGGVLFCIDRTPLAEANRLLYRGVKPAAPAMILALDVRTGKELWHTGKDVFGTWLSYSARHDVLVQAGRPSRDMLADEVDSRLIAFQGTTGKVLWDKKDKYDGPILLHDAKVITQKTAVNLLTGKTVDRVHPLTGENSKWEIKRYHGCGTAIGSTNLLTFPSAGAGFFDLAADGGTGNLGGFKSGCTSSLIVADGVLNSPDYTRNCTCSFQNRTSLAMVYMPDVEMWTFQHFDRGKGHVRQVGVNFGAPGDRRAEASPGSGAGAAGAATGAKAGATPGTLWLEYPIVGGPGPKLDIAVEPTEPNQPDSVTWFRHHISQACGDGPPWVIASGMEGATQVSIRMEDVKDAKERTYTVSLYFAEPGPAKAGQRVFDVAIQDKTVLKDFDVMAQTRRPLSGLVRTFRGVKVVSLLTIRLTPSPSAAVPRSVLCGVEVVEEKKE